MREPYVIVTEKRNAASPARPQSRVERSRHAPSLRLPDISHSAVSADHAGRRVGRGVIHDDYLDIEEPHRALPAHILSLQPGTNSGPGYESE